MTIGKLGKHGKIIVVDRNGGGICWGVEPSYDIELPGMIYKHIADSEVEEYRVYAFSKRER